VNERSLRKRYGILREEHEYRGGGGCRTNDSRVVLGPPGATLINLRHGSILHGAVEVSDLEEITALLNKTIGRHGLWDT
jgi:hypothetical protein